jgi:hypothetical protein
MKKAKVKLSFQFFSILTSFIIILQLTGENRGFTYK